MTEKAENKGMVVVAGEVHNASLASFLGKFEMSLHVSPETIRMVTEQIQVIDRMYQAMAEVTVIERGKRFIWLKVNLKHGEFLEHLKEHFPHVPIRSIQWWMAEARYAMEHGGRRSNAQKTANLALLNAPGAAHFDESEGDDFSADDLADPSKPAPRPRSELEFEVQKLEKRLKAAKNREETLLNDRDGLSRRLQDEKRKKDPDAADEENCPIKSSLIRGRLALGRCWEMVKDAQNMKQDFSADCPGRVFASLTSQLQSVIQELCDVAGQNAVRHATEHNAKKAAEKKRD